MRIRSFRPLCVDFPLALQVPLTAQKHAREVNVNSKLAVAVGLAMVVCPTLTMGFRSARLEDSREFYR